MTKIKICGITNLADGRVAVEAGVDYLGFIFYGPSPRYIRPAAARQIVAALKRDAPRLITVGVFVDAAPEKAAHILDECGLDAAQLHGQEPPEFVAALGGRAYKALRPQTEAEAEAALAQYADLAGSPELPRFLLDAYHPTLYGGTGHVTDWEMAAGIARQYPIMLAGSLTPANVVEAIRRVRPWGVDVSSGVEREKGRKDHQKIKEFVRRVRDYEG